MFIAKLATATDGHFHVSSDGWRSYPKAIKRQLGHRVDHGVMQKVYGTNVNATGRYSPARIIGSWKQAMHGQPYQDDQICTSHVERMNGSIRHFIKRMARLTCAFSKRWTNHRAALAVFFAHYNWCRKPGHSLSFRPSPAAARQVRLAMMATTRFRIWHLLALIVFVALWVPLSQWLLALEAKDYPRKPQETIDVLAFYLGTASIIGVPVGIAWIVVRGHRERKRRDSAFTNFMRSAPIVPTPAAAFDEA